MCLETLCAEVDIPTSRLPIRLYRKRKRQRDLLCNRVLKLRKFGLSSVGASMTRTAAQVQICPIDEIPLYPMYESEVLRYQSFIDYRWPRCLKNYAEPLAAFGYFYLGKSTSVVCFQCGLALNNWRGNLSTEDVILEAKIQHAVLNTQCLLVLPLYGDRYFHQQFLNHDIQYNNAYLKTFLEETGSENRELHEYFRLREERNNPAPVEKEVDGASDKDNIVLLRRHVKTLEAQIAAVSRSHDTMCGICDTNQKNVVTLPCGHVFSCGECFRKTVIDADNVKCSCCRKQVLAYTHAYLV